ncbi:hypothetical protein SAMN05216255_1216 [Pseudomonas segetis]|uniref:Uncharacterized protein n=1 Tax=Pseudomonas segetis TaxID=298908 RepID=A0A239AI29_9PSED|nr:hypothetical protein SAMN05216255_1216 [Pseudomonas segetis]
MHRCQAFVKRFVVVFHHYYIIIWMTGKSVPVRH